MSVRTRPKPSITPPADREPKQLPVTGRSPARLVPIRRAAELLHLHPRTYRRLMDAGKVPRGVRVGGSLRFDLDELTRWCDAGCPPREKWEAIDKQQRARARART